MIETATVAALAVAALSSTARAEDRTDRAADERVVEFAEEDIIIGPCGPRAFLRRRRDPFPPLDLVPALLESVEQL